METEYTIRKMDESDLPGLKALVWKEWFSQYDMSEDFGKKALSMYVARYTNRSTSALAFDTGGKTVGYLLGYASGEPFVFPQQEVDLDFSDNQYVNLFKRVLEADDRMLDSCKDRGFDSELLLFIVDSTCRGMRIGSRLLDAFAKDAAASGHRLMYLFTDDYCNMGFYERIGCKVAAREKVLSDGADHTFVMLELDLVKYVQG